MVFDPMITFGNLISIGAILIAVGAAWYKLGGIAENRKSIHEHKIDNEPHKSCPAHAEMIKAMKSELGSISYKLNIMDQRIFDIWKNGNKK